MSKYGVLFGPYFPVFGLNTKIYGVNLCIQSEYRKIQTRKNSVFGHFSRSEGQTLFSLQIFENKFVQNHWFLKSSQLLFTCSKFTKETPKQCMKSVTTERVKWRRSSAFIINFKGVSIILVNVKKISYIAPVFPLLTLNK